jgi:hypothetical protein
MGGGGMSADMNRKKLPKWEFIDRAVEIIEETRLWGPEGRPDDYIEEPWDLKVQAARIKLEHRLEQRRKNGGG